MSWDGFDGQSGNRKRNARRLTSGRRPEGRQNVNAENSCKAEQANTAFATTHGGKTFAQFYATNKNGRDALGNCVSQKAQAAAQAQNQATINAARSCRAEQKANPADFKTKYGTNANKSNAFGKCVSQKAKA